MWRWKSSRIILSMIGFLLGLGLFVVFAIDIIREGDGEDSHRSFGLYLGSAKPIGSGNCDKDYYDPDPGKGWGGNNIARQRAMSYEDWIGMEVAHQPEAVSNLSEEERAKLYDWLGRKMHLMQDMAHSFQESLSLAPFPEQIPGEQEREQEKVDLQK